MRGLIPLSLLFAHVQSENLKGTCVDGTDPMGVEQTCYGRCHIYESGPGWYGACDSYAVQPVDVTGPCGDSPQNACLSTFNAGWDTQKTNCGNCYYVEMKYADGVVKSTYLKTMDTNGSETKFEMNGPAWVNLCPFVCAGTGDCSHDEASCPNGIIAQTSTYPGPISCTNLRTLVTFKRVDCAGSDAPTTPVPNSVPAHTTAPVTTASVTTPETALTRPTVPTTPPVTAPRTAVSRSTHTVLPTTHTTPDIRPIPSTPAPTSEPVPGTSPRTVTRTVPRTVTHTVPRTVTRTATQSATSEAVPPSSSVLECQASLVAPTNQSWTEECQSLCQYYGGSDVLCPGRQSPDTLISCVKKAAPYCQLAGNNSSTAASVTGCQKTLGHATNPSWSSGCKDLCAYYGGNSAFCPAADSVEGLVSCVLSAAPYCERV